MRLSTVTVLARPSAPADRGRAMLLAGSTSLAGALLIAAVRIARYGGESDNQVITGRLAPYVEQDGLRPGVVLGVLLLTVPVFALTVQALRTGSVARERRLAALRLAGATPGDVRRVSAAEAAGAALVGGLLAGPLYLVLWVLLGVLPAESARLLPTPSVGDVAVWAGLVVLLATAGGVVGALVERRVLVDPLDVQRRAVAPPMRSRWWLVAGVAVLLLGFELFRRDSSAPVAVVGVMVAGVLAIAFSAGTRYARRRGRRLTARGGAADVLAGARLLAEPRAAGRVAGVLAVCGVALGIEGVMVADIIRTRHDNFAEDMGFYLTGFALAGVGVLVAVVVAVLTLLVGAADQLVDSRRPLASLAAMGTDEPTLLHALRRQLTAASVPAVVVGVLAGGVVVGALTTFSRLGWVLLPVLGTALVAGIVVALVGRLAARLLRPRLRAAMDPENLRVA